MGRKKSDKPRMSPFDPNYAPYGRTTEKGNPDAWRAAFEYAMSDEEAKVILGDESPWAVLGIPRGSSGADIKRAYRKLALKHHPDHGGDAEMFKKVKAAYVTLGSPR